MSVEYSTKEQVHNRGCEAVGKTMGELAASMDEKASGKKSKVGDAWESWFGVDKNSIAGADLSEAGVELKATPVKHTKNGISAKERLVLNIINYEKEFDKSFPTSSFWKKNQLMELGFYEHIPGKKWQDYELLKSVLFTYPEKDLLIIKQDWEKIHDYIKTGRAHELSEGITMYLSACTKGASSKSVRAQHESLNAPKAKQRAYSLKSGYMTYLLREFIFGENEDPHVRVKPFADGEVFEWRAPYYTGESIVKDISILQNTSLENYIIDSLKPYVGKTVSELANQFGIGKDAKGNYPKAINAMLASRMLGIQKDLEKTEEFFKANIQVKTIRVQKNHSIKESMSFPAFDFKELVQEDWEESMLRDLLDSAKFFFVVFEEQDSGEYVFKGAKFWSMPESDLENIVRLAWQQTVDTIKFGVQLHYDGKRVTNNFIGKSDKRIIHVRPHASKSSYIANDKNANQLPTPAIWTNKPANFANDWMTKQCFWLNNDYVFEQIKDLL